MTANQTQTIPPVDPNLLTGFSRIGYPMVQMKTVTLDTLYGEFATRLYVGVSGHVSVIKWDGTTQILQNLAAGVVHNICSLGINTSGTTATNIVWGS